MQRGSILACVSMKVPSALAEAFGPEFEQLISKFCETQKWIDSSENLQSKRFLGRSIAPHILRLSQMFNRLTPEDRETPLTQQAYWKQSSNPKNLRMAYFLYFMPANAFRMASIWAELARLGYQFPASKNDATIRALELGCGPGSGATGVGTGACFSDLPLQSQIEWTLMDKDRSVLQIAEKWVKSYFHFRELSQWKVQTRPHSFDMNSKTFLPPGKERFHLWVMSYFLNEFEDSPESIANQLIQAWEERLENRGLVFISEPALKAESRKLLALRKALIERFEKERLPYQVILPCLGHQTCDAFQDPEDWCHEDVLWWRPEYIKKIDQLTGLNRRSLPFSYLVIIKDSHPIDKILSKIGKNNIRLVSPSYKQGPDREFYLCGQDGKRKARLKGQTVGRGDIIVDAEVRGDVNASRVGEFKTILTE